MAVTLNDKQKKLITDKNFGHIATLNKDGSPQVSPVWIELDGNYLVVNTEQKRLKTRNIKRDPRVAVSIQNAENPYQYIEIRGRAVEVTDNGGFEGIDRLSAKYTGQEKYPGNAPGDVRIVIKIEPEHVTGMNV
jgi:PPOX class probable F420-dependent enzyme